MVSQYTQWNLPAQEFEGTWEALIYDDDEEGDGDAEDSRGKGAASAGSAGAKRARPTETAGSSTGAGASPSRARIPDAPGSEESDPDGGSLQGSRLKPALLQYAASALLFSDAGVDTSLISWNHVILLHGPPGE